MRSHARFTILLMGIAFFTLFLDDIARLSAAALILSYRAALRFTVPALGWMAEHAVTSRVRRLAILLFPVLGTLRVWMRFHARRYRAWWGRRSAREKFAIALVPVLAVTVVGLFSGSLLGLLALLSIAFPRTVASVIPILASFLRKLAKRAAMRGVEPWLDAVWKRVPERPRRFVDRAYGRLWYWTMFKIAHSRRRAMRRAARGGIIVIVWVWLSARAPGIRARRS